MPRDTVMVRGVLLRTTNGARLFRVQDGRDGTREVWVPRSITHHLSVYNTQTGECTFEVEEWFAEREALP